jgi:hypothetical protein
LKILVQHTAVPLYRRITSLKEAAVITNQGKRSKALCQEEQQVHKTKNGKEKRVKLFL